MERRCIVVIEDEVRPEESRAPEPGFVVVIEGNVIAVPTQLERETLGSLKVVIEN